MNEETYTTALADLADVVTPMADVANEIGAILGMSTSAADGLAMSWASWCKRLDGRPHTDPTFVSLDEWIVHWQAQWPTSDPPVLGAHRTFWANERVFALATQRRCYRLPSMFATRPALVPLFPVYKALEDTWNSEIWFAVGWLGRRYYQAVGEATP